MPRLLMGRRAARLAFLPGQYVFPGGRVEIGDFGSSGRMTLPAPTRERLMAATASGFTERRAIAIARAAVRETFEEVGVRVGSLGDGDMAEGVSSLAPVARAITPPGHIRRFDTRFFCVSADSVVAPQSFVMRADDEFDHVDWFPLDRLDTLDLPGITRHVLADIDTRLRDGSWRDTSRAMPFYRTRHGRPVREMI